MLHMLYRASLSSKCYVVVVEAVQELHCRCWLNHHQHRGHAKVDILYHMLSLAAGVVVFFFEPCGTPPQIYGRASWVDKSSG
jgi:hypothetical protein